MYDLVEILNNVNCIGNDSNDYVRNLVRANKHRLDRVLFGNEVYVFEKGENKFVCIYSIDSNSNIYERCREVGGTMPFFAEIGYSVGDTVWVVTVNEDTEYSVVYPLPRKVTVKKIKGSASGVYVFYEIDGITYSVRQEFCFSDEVSANRFITIADIQLIRNEDLHVYAKQYNRPFKLYEGYSIGESAYSGIISDIIFSTETGIEIVLEEEMYDTNGDKIKHPELYVFNYVDYYDNKNLFTYEVDGTEHVAESISKSVHVSSNMFDVLVK